jgi:hypothetical protein
LKASAALITMKAGLAIRSRAFSRRYTEASETKLLSLSVKRMASSRQQRRLVECQLD